MGIFDFLFTNNYEAVYDEEGGDVSCPNVLCDDGEICWKDGEYVCPYCGTKMTRAEFFDWIGAEPPGPKCLTCDNLYPGCTYCPYGYDVGDDDE